MKIAIHDADSEHLIKKRFPNYALMKISAYHKSQGDMVEWWTPLFKYDRVYSSKIFDFTPENPYLPEYTTRGGTGYLDIPINKALSPEIDAMFPDYSIYPYCDFSIGYITRGCPNHCRWCVVPEKEGSIKPYREWQELARPDSKKLVLMDNNILASPFGVSQLESLIDSGYSIDLNQGMDARLVDNCIAQIISRLNWIRYIRFSCDTIGQIESIQRAADLLQQYGVKPYRLFIYLLVTTDLEDASARVEALKKIGGICLYAQAERNGKKRIIPNAAQMEFSQRYVYSGTFRRESWAEYCTKRNLSKKFILEAKQDEQSRNRQRIGRSR